MRIILPLSAALLIATPAAAREAPSPQHLRGTVEKLVSFGTRHSLSSATDPKRGIGAARSWVASEFAALSKQCGGCITVERLSRRFTGPRAPDGVVIEDVLGIQKGSDPNRFVIVGGHIDSRVTDVMNTTADAPGANDDGSGVALVMEAARILSKEKFAANIVYVAFSGEEQGLWGATLLAQTAKARGWQVDAMLNNDIVGNSIGQGGVKAADHVRVFSEGIRSSENLAEQIERRAIGGEDDGPSRALAKAVHGIAEGLPGGFAAAIERRPDRFGRSGDHEPFLREGYPAVRFTVAAENWDRQHQDLRTENGRVYGDTIEGMDFDYLAKVTAINVATLARVAAAPAAPASATIAGALGRDTTVTWRAVPGARSYRIHWRAADRSDWSDTRDVTGATSTVLKDVPVDDHFVGVSAIGADGMESLVTFAGRATAK
ncbi:MULTISPECIES: M20/M25/M40 family metallo-hydrolase [unclassified Sphingomonas]|uniref:M20/M25/M40 family metallo-hydrolase n=1 Tax=unclassified Sphingomonas TaxID=196159 RepID=UPI0009258DDB|nr:MULTISPECIES: M20/M25/M40 family metallo-hydrolase [unclassified Sphingomonas]MBN8849524.1 M20/M25/M40 family metallo-hydrolase [Sphingomonas sp.]OJV34609.1 MAG: peptidase M28 [Sphingomonas sp. 67-36]